MKIISRMRMAFKKILQEIAPFYRRGFLSALFSVMIFATLASVVHADEGIKFDIDNLRTQGTSSVEAYDIVQVKSAWEKIISSGAPLFPVSIGIIDSGIDITHPEFMGIQVGPSLVGAVNFAHTPISAKTDSTGHGTRVAGIIGANNLSGSGVSLPPSSPQMNGILGGLPGSAAYSMEMRKVTGGDFFTTAFTLTELSLENVHIVNISQGLSRPANIFTAASWDVYAGFYDSIFSLSPNILFIVSAGNDNQNANQMSPANSGFLNNVITVGATDNEDNRGDFGFLVPGKGSNFGNVVSLSAPGVRIYSPIAGGGYDPNSSGTSFAAPFVTGVAGLIKSIKGDQITAIQIKEILTKIENTDPITLEAGKPIGRRLNALKAVCDPVVLNCAPAPTGDGTIQGTLRLKPADGGGVFAGARIFLISATNEQVAQIQTDANGHYAFTAPAGSYTLYVDSYFISGTSNCGETIVPATIASGQTTTQDIVFAYTPGGICQPS